jgi:probable F420-dependent oxidoreductase
MTYVTGTGVWSGGFRYGDPVAAADAAAQLEELGYTALWMPDVGGDVIGAVDNLLSATRRVIVATGVLNLWRHTTLETAEGYDRLTKSHGDRFLVGIGVSHAAHIDAEEPGRYTRPLKVMAGFLDGLDAAPMPLPSSRRVLAALGPKMQELARERAAGTHPYNVTPEHTASTRQTLGPQALVLPEQAVAVTSDAFIARELGRKYIERYLGLPNYTNNFRRLGFTDEDLSGGGSDRLIDAMVAWGAEDDIRRRIQEHRDAGADHVCIQVLSDAGRLPMSDYQILAPVLTV